MRISRQGTRRVVTGVILTSMLLVFSALASAQDEGNPEVSRLLEEARTKAVALSQDADEMEAMTRTDASWESHADALNMMKEHVNDLARVVEKLNAARDSASPWQRQAIDRMIPLMKELATNTTAAINHLNQNQARPVSGSYPEYLKENAETAHQLADMISSFVQYGQARAKVNRLEQKLETASNSR